VDYELTALGRSFLKPMLGLLDWAQNHHEQVRAARQAYVPPPRHEAL
jgi:DNA-binding HxlR family transcriptional regulator